MLTFVIISWRGEKKGIAVKLEKTLAVVQMKVCGGLRQMNKGPVEQWDA